MAASLSNDNQNPKVPEISITITETPAAETSGRSVMISNTKDVVECSVSSKKKKAKKIIDSPLAIILQKLIQAVPRTAAPTVYRDSLSLLPKRLLRDIRSERGKFKLQKIPQSIEREVESLVEGLNVTERETTPDVVIANEESSNVNINETETEDVAVEDEDNEQIYDLPFPEAMLVMVYVNENMQFQFNDAFNTVNIFPENYPDWNSLAQSVRIFWSSMHGPNLLPPLHALLNATPANCWPGHVTCFGRVSVVGDHLGVTFDRYNWTEYDFLDARDYINALAVIRF